MAQRRIYCVTGGEGYVGSWLVKTLLERGYIVHATLRDLENPKIVDPLNSLEGAEVRLRLFKADLLEENSFDKAVEGCHGVFHVASPLELFETSEEEVVVPAVKGVLNVLNSCIRSKTVKRVVVTSSVAAAAACSYSDKAGLIGCIDESRWTPLEFMRQSQEEARFYFVSKVLAEQEALKFGEEHKNEIEVVTILPAIVAGPFITSELPRSCGLLSSFFIGNETFLHALKVISQFIGSTPLVHTEDVCNAHIFVMEHPTAQGRHICSSVAVSLSYLSNYLAHNYPQLPLKLQVKEADSGRIIELSSQKLIDMGFEFKHGFPEIVDDCISAAVAHGTLQLLQVGNKDSSEGPN